MGINWTFRVIIKGIKCMLFNIHRQVSMKYTSHLPANDDGTVCSEKTAYKIHKPRNYPEESIQLSEQGDSLQSRRLKYQTWKDGR